MVTFVTADLSYLEHRGEGKLAIQARQEAKRRRQEHVRKIRNKRTWYKASDRAIFEKYYGDGSADNVRKIYFALNGKHSENSIRVQASKWGLTHDDWSQDEWAFAMLCREWNVSDVLRGLTLAGFSRSYEAVRFKVRQCRELSAEEVSEWLESYYADTGKTALSILTWVQSSPIEAPKRAVPNAWTEPEEYYVLRAMALDMSCSKIVKYLAQHGFTRTLGSVKDKRSKLRALSEAERAARISSYWRKLHRGASDWAGWELAIAWIYLYGSGREYRAALARLGSTKSRQCALDKRLNLRKRA